MQGKGKDQTRQNGKYAAKVTPELNVQSQNSVQAPAGRRTLPVDKQVRRSGTNVSDTANSQSQGKTSAGGAGDSAKNHLAKNGKNKVIPTGSFNLDDEKNPPILQGLPVSQDMNSDRDNRNRTQGVPDGFSSAPQSLSNINSGEQRPNTADARQDKETLRSPPLPSRALSENQDNAEDEDSDESLTSAEQTKLKKILKMVMGSKGFFDDVSDDNIEDYIDKENDEKDPLEDYVEGIFIFQAHKGTCQIPVDEEVYLKNYPGDEFMEQLQEPIIKSPNKEPETPATPGTGLTLERLDTLQQSNTQIKKEEWEYAKKIAVYDRRSMFIFDHTTCFRRFIVMIVEHKAFDNLILLLIALNTIQLGIYDYNDRENCMPYNKALELASKAFSYAFMVECALRVVAMGFVAHPNAYLRDAWNWIDFTVVLISVIEETPIQGANLKGLRTLRVLRPLKSIKGFPAMKRQLSALQNSMVPLGHATAFIAMLFVLFGILGVSQFAGAFYQRCRFVDEINGEMVPRIEDGQWLWDEDQDRLCSLNGGGTYTCNAGTVCGTPLEMNKSYPDYGPLEAYSDNIVSQELINFGVTTFDNLAFSTVTIIQMITLEGWVLIMYNLMDAGNPVVAILFCCLVVMVCSWFLLNIVLAVLGEGIEGVDDDQTTDIIKANHAKSIKRARLQKLKKLNITSPKSPKSPKHSHDESKSRSIISPKCQSGSFAEDSQTLPADTESKALPRSRSQQDEIKPTQEFLTPGTDLRSDSIDKKHVPLYKVDPDEINQKIRDAVPRKQQAGANKNQLEEVPEEVSDASHLDLKGQRFGNSIKSRPDYIKVPESSCDNSVQEIQGTSVVAPSPMDTVEDARLSKDRQYLTVDPNIDAPPKSPQHTPQTPALTPKKAKEEEEIPDFAKKNRFFMCFYKICSHSAFNNTITFLIVANTVVLALDRHNVPPEEQAIYDILGQFFTWAFVAEMVIKLLGIGFKNYAKDSFNLFDAVIVTLSMVEFAVEQSGNESVGGGAFQVLRAIRILRIFKLARRWKKLAQLLEKMYKTIIEIRTFAVLMFIFMVILMLLGLELFAYKIRYDENEDPIFYDSEEMQCPPKDSGILPIPYIPPGESPRENFNNPLFGLITVFIIFVGDDWNSIMYTHYRVTFMTSSTTAWIGNVYFILVFIVGNLVLLNLFLAILLKNFEGEEPEEENAEEESSEEEDEEMTGCQKLKLWCCIKFCPCCNKEDLEEPTEEIKIGVEVDADGKPLSKFAIAFRRMLLEGVPQSMKHNPDQESEEQEEQAECFESEQNSRSGSPTGTRADNNIKGSKSMIVRDGKTRNDDNAPRRSASVTPSPDKKMSMSSPGMSPKENVFASLRNLKRKIANAKQQARDEAKNKYNSLKEAPLVTMATIKKSELTIEVASSKVDELELKGNSLFCLSPTNFIRRFTKAIVTHKHFDNLVLFLIAVSTILLCMEMPLSDPESRYNAILAILDRIMTILFIIEMVLKIVTLGFAFGEGAYLKSGWNDMDFVIVMVSIFDLLPIDADISFIKVIRLLRVLRPLRMIAKNKGMKIAVESIIKSIPEFGHLLLISFMFLGLFSIIGVTFYKGLFYSCETSNIGLTEQENIHTMWECLDYGGEWLNTQANFDNFINGLTTFFTVMTSEGWVTVMWMSVDCADEFHTPIKNNKLFSTFFFIVFIIAGALFILNLFVGVVIGQFGTEKEKLVRNNLITDLQEEYCTTMVKVYQAMPVEVYQLTGNPCMDKLYIFATSTFFENAVFICIVINTFCMAATWYAESDGYTWAMEQVNLVFTIIYTVEAIIKITVFGKKYFKDGWNVFDFLIVVVSWLGFFLEAVFKLNVGSAATIIRSFRVARVFKMIRRFKSMRKIFNTFVVALPELGNVGSLLLLLLLLFSILGVFFFSKVKLQEHLNEHANFQNFGYAMLTLLRSTTGEAFNDVMFDITRTRTINYQCTNVDQDYASLNEFGPQMCGQSSLATAYFVTFMLGGFVILLNLFIAIILENYDNSQKEEAMRIGESTIEFFIQTWKKYDPRASKFIPVDDLENIVMDLVVAEIEQLGDDNSMTNPKLFNLTRDKMLLYHVKQKKGLPLDEKMAHRLRSQPMLQNQLNRVLLQFTGKLAIPSYDKTSHYNFHDTLTALARHVFEEQQVRDFRDRKLRIEENQKYGIELTKWDKMKEGTNAFLKLPITEQEEFLEKDAPEFSKVLNRLEQKGLNKKEPIDKLQSMKELRIKRGSNLRKLDDKGKELPEEYVLDQDPFGHVLDSSIRFGIIVLKRFIRRWKEQREIDYAEAEKLFAEGKNLNGSQKRILNLERAKRSRSQIVFGSNTSLHSASNRTPRVEKDHKEREDFKNTMLLLDSGSGSEDEDDDPKRDGGAQAIKIVETTEPDHADFLMTQQDGDEFTYQKEKSPPKQEPAKLKSPASQKQEPKKSTGNQVLQVNKPVVSPKAQKVSPKAQKVQVPKQQIQSPKAVQKKPVTKQVQKSAEVSLNRQVTPIVPAATGAKPIGKASELELTPVMNKVKTNEKIDNRVGQSNMQVNVNQVSDGSLLLMSKDDELDRDLKLLVDDAARTNAHKFQMEETAFLNNSSEPRQNQTHGVGFQPPTKQGNLTKEDQQKGKDADEFNIFNMQSQQETYLRNRADETGGGVRADDSPLNSVPSDYGTTQKSRTSIHKKVQNIQMQETVFDNHDGDGSRKFRGEQVHAQVINRHSEMSLEMVAGKSPLQYKDKTGQKTVQQSAQIPTKMSAFAESQRQAEEWSRQSPYKKPIQRGKYAKTTSPKSGQYAQRPDVAPRIGNYEYVPDGRQYLRQTFDNSKLMNSNMTNNEKIIELQKQEKYELMTVSRKPSVNPRPPSKQKNKMHKYSKYEGQNSSKKLTQQEYQTHTATAFGSAGVLGSSYMQKPAPTFIPSAMKTDEEGPLHGSPTLQKQNFQIQGNTQKRLRKDIERHSSMTNDRNIFDLSSIKNNPNELFSATTYGGLGIGAGLTVNLGMGPTAKASQPALVSSKQNGQEWRTKRTSYDPSLTSKSLMIRNRQQ